MIERKFGRLENPDERDKLFPLSTAIPQNVEEVPKSKYWWDEGWWGDQGSSTQCVAYSWCHFIEDGPVIQNKLPENRKKPLIDPQILYRESQLRDPWPGENYPGTSVRSAAKVLKELGVLKEYRWASNVQDIIDYVLHVGPVVVGTKWFSMMTNPQRNNIMKPYGNFQGGHAYVINGVDTEKGLFRVKNSWGKSWGDSGHAYIQIEDFEGLLNNGGEACAGFENKLETQDLDWSKLRPPGVYTD